MPAVFVVTFGIPFDTSLPRFLQLFYRLVPTICISGAYFRSQFRNWSLLESTHQAGLYTPGNAAGSHRGLLRGLFRQRRNAENSQPLWSTEPGKALDTRQWLPDYSYELPPTGSF